nr:glycosyltransferase [Pseudomonadota bacterium]
LPKHTKHINAGVSLINLSAIRKFDFLGEIYKYLEAKKYVITLGDQQIINTVFFDQILYLSPIWNIHGSMFDLDWCKINAGLVNTFTIDELRDAAEAPAIIHYTFKRKPWISSDHPLSDYWYEYASLTEYFANDSFNSRKTASKNTFKLNGDLMPSSRLRKKIDGYIKSIIQLRKTRLNVDKLISDPKSSANYNLTKATTFQLQNTIISSSAAKTVTSAVELLDQIPEYATVLTNCENRDLDGGFHENIKTLLKTPNIGRDFDVSEVNATMIAVQRLGQKEFIETLYCAAAYSKPHFYVETSFFGALAPYFHKDVPAKYRRCFGYIFDDLGYYYDSRLPSRLERILNSEMGDISEDEKTRSKALIKKIIDLGITKYNVGLGNRTMNIDSDSVLVIDQKRNDASIEFGAASSKTFDIMLASAIRENPDSKIYFKTHPDNSGNELLLNDPRVEVIPENVSVTALLDQCRSVYVVTSQLGFEALLRGKEVNVFGLPFYSGWGLTKDRQKLARRDKTRTIEELFYSACIRMSAYVNPDTGNLVELEDALDYILTCRTEIDQL